MRFEDSLRLFRSLLQPVPDFLPPQHEPLFAAVVSDDLEEFTRLVEDGRSFNIRNRRGNSLLNVVMRRRRTKMFDYLLSRPEIDVNFVDKRQQTPLLYLMRECFDEYFAMELIKKGADVRKTDSSGFTCLHLAARGSGDNLAVGRLIIERGGEVNKQGHFGVTPLYVACEGGNLDWICMLLYYGADPTLSTDRGVLPLAVIPKKFQAEDVRFLFDHTFDHLVTTVTLPTLVAAMTRNSPLFPKILDHVVHVDYNFRDLGEFAMSLVYIEPHILRLFLAKFGRIVEDMFFSYQLLDRLAVTTYYGSQELTQLLPVLLNSPYIGSFVESLPPENSTISLLFKVMVQQEQTVAEQEFADVIYMMLRHGLSVTSKDLDTIFDNYGYCELFRVLLHMDVVMLGEKQESMARLYYDPHGSIDKLSLTSKICVNLIKYYNRKPLKNFILANSDEGDLIKNVERMPQVPLLLELSREAARRHIVNVFKIDTSAHFNTVLQHLPVGRMNKEIVALEKTLY